MATLSKLLPALALSLVACAASAQYPVVVENRPGGDSAIAAEAVTRMTPDGYTIFFGSNSAMTAAVARLLEINRDDLALWRRLVAQAGIALE